jgi:uncharacterized protein YaaN involved in tellurite resistance
MTETLNLPATADVKKELALRDPTTIQADPGQEGDLDKRAGEFVEQLINLKPENLDDSAAGKASVETMGAEIQKKAAAQSEMLKRPLADLSKRGAEGGVVAKSIVDLKMQVEDLDPGKLDFQPGWFSRAVGKVPGVGTPLKRYFSKYESAQTVIAAIVRSLEQGRDELGRDNVTLSEDQRRMQELSQKLERAIKLGQLIDQKLQYKLDRELDAASPQRKFVAEELLFPLRQRMLDLQQQLAVNQQGVLAMELIIRNNQELVRGVNRSLNVTVNALQTAVTVAMALENQKIVLDRMDAINQTTSNLIAGTAQRLKTQGVQIQQRAAATSLNMDSLKAAFADIHTAISDLSDFRQKALPQMASAVLELDRLSTDAKTEIDKLNLGQRTRPQLTIEPDPAKVEAK